MSDYSDLLRRALESDAIGSIKTIKGKPYLYSKGKYVGPASKIPDMERVRLLRWTIKNLPQVLKAAKLISDLSKNQ